MDPRLEDRLARYAASLRLGKGVLSVFLVVTDHARKLGLPLDPDRLLTEGEGQVKGVGKGPVQKILARHGITKVLAREGGRTSRKSLKYMRTYVALLNDLNVQALADLDAIEAFWITKVQDFLAGKPFRLTMDPNRSMRSVVRDLLSQAIARQRPGSGRTDAGALLQHLVGAKLACAMEPEIIEHHSYSTADASTDRPGDFALGDTVVHVTTFPGDGVIGRCKQNLQDGLRPILITLANKMATAADHADDAGIADQLEVLDIEQFLALNLHEWGRFETRNRPRTLRRLVDRYNRIVEAVETDPSLRIEIG